MNGTCTRHARGTQPVETSISVSVRAKGSTPSAANHLDEIENGVRQFAAANRIFSREFQQRWIPKVVSALEDDALPHQIRMLVQVDAQASTSPASRRSTARRNVASSIRS